MTKRSFATPLDALRYHVTGAIERGEGEAIVEIAPERFQVVPSRSNDMNGINFKTFEHHSDAAHGWLIVEREQFEASGLTEADISQYSYQRAWEASGREVIALEEDCDCQTFLDAWKAKHGECIIHESYSDQDRSTVRNWRQFGTQAHEFALANT